MLSFKAQKVSDSTIYTLNADGKTYPKTASIVQLDANSSYDRDAIEKLSRFWCGNKCYVKSINDNFKKDSFGSQRHYIALTTQCDNFEKLNPLEIYGVAQYSDYNGGYNLDLIQTMPKIKYGKTRSISHVGYELISYLKSRTKTFIELSAVKSAIEFYKKLGFSVLDKKISSIVRMRFDIKI